MLLWLDFLLFGNGNGLKSPHCDDKIYWLAGKMYWWIGGFGAQLKSFEWSVVPTGTRRRLCGKDFVVFQARRRFVRVETSWTLAQSQTLTIEAIRELKEHLDRST